MKSELKTALIFGILIVMGVGVLSVIFSSLDEQIPTTNVTRNENMLNIDKSGFNCLLSKHNTRKITKRDGG